MRTPLKARTKSYLNPKLTRPKNTGASQRGRHIITEDLPALNRDTAAVSRAKFVCRQTTPHRRRGATMTVAEAEAWVAPFKAHGSSCHRGRELCRPRENLKTLETPAHVVSSIYEA